MPGAFFGFGPYIRFLYLSKFLLFCKYADGFHKIKIDLDGGKTNALENHSGGFTENADWHAL